MEEERTPETWKHIYNTRSKHLHDMDVILCGIRRTRDNDLRKDAIGVYRSMAKDLEEFERLAEIPRYKRTDLKKQKRELDLWEITMKYRPIEGYRPVGIVGTDFRFESINQAAQFFGIKKITLGNKLRRGEKINGYQLEWLKKWE